MFCGEISYPWPPFLLGGGGVDRQGVVLSGYLPEMLFCRLRCLSYYSVYNLITIVALLT